MTAKIIDGKLIAKNIRENIKIDVGLLSKKPGLAVILAGNDPASKIYVSHKQKACEEAGIASYKYELPPEVSSEEVFSLIRKLNDDPKINGILVQLPLPKQIDQRKIINAISPQKDVDCFHPANVGRMMIDASYAGMLPATPKGIIRLIESTGEEISGKHAVVVGRSNIVGKPAGMLLLSKNATVTYCHSRTENLPNVIKQADILVVAVGKARMITADMIKKGAIIIDVGINRDENGRLCGDVDFENAKEAASYITPVPGGVGPMTIAMLLENLLIAYKMQQKSYLS